MITDPWLTAWYQLVAAVDSGAITTLDEVDAYARDLGRDLPDPWDTTASTQLADAVMQVVRDLRDMENA